MPQDGTRTVRDFVRSLCLRGLSDKAVRAVAANCRWKTHMTEVDDLLDRRGDRWREKGARGDVSDS